MKFDKQQLIKHHFWILLGVFGLFAFLLMILVPVMVGAEADAKEAEIDKTNKTLDGNANPTTKAFTDELDKQITQINGRRESLWHEMFGRQREIVVFPATLHGVLKNLRFGDEIDRAHLAAYREAETYAASYDELPQIVRPTAFLPNAAAVLKPIPWKRDRLPSSEEVWLSLEDMCVRREVLHMIQEANVIASRFTEVAATTASPIKQSPMGKDFAKRHVNRWYEIDLVVTDNGRGNYTFGGRIKNVSGRRKKIYQLDLDVYLTPPPTETEPARPVTVSFPIAALAAGEDVPLPDIKMVLNQPPVRLYKIELHHNADTVPVKFISQIAFGPNAAGHRLADRKLVMAKFSKPAEPAGGGNPMGAAPGPMGFGPMGAMAGGRGEGGAGGSATLESTINGVVKNRYIDVTDQVRRMPIAMVLVVDQSCLQDVLASVVNSDRLRFQTTQYHWKRVYMTGASEGSEGEPPASGEGGERSRGPMGGDAGPMTPMGGIGPRPPMGFGPMGPMGAGPMGGAGAATAPEPTQTHLVELTVYGVANIYERPKDPLKTPAGTPTPPNSSPPVVQPMQPNPPTPAVPKPPVDPKTNPMKPVDPKPAEPAKPMSPAKPSDAKPMTPGDTKPADPKSGGPEKPAGEKPADSKPSTPPAGKPPAGEKPGDSKPSTPPAGKPPAVN